MEEKVFIQVQSSKREREMLSELAKNRDMSMSAVVRTWIREAHKRMAARDQ